MVYVADTYNSKLKVIDLEKGTCTTVLGGDGDGWLAGPVLSEPSARSQSGAANHGPTTQATRAPAQERASA